MHKTGTYDVCKNSLSCFDDKRYILDDGIISLVDFHKNAKGNKINGINYININEINEIN